METITIKTGEFGNITIPKEFANELCVIYNEASESYSKRNHIGLSKRASDMCHLIFITLLEAGYYDDEVIIL